MELAKLVRYYNEYRRSQVADILNEVFFVGFFGGCCCCRPC